MEPISAISQRSGAGDVGTYVVSFDPNPGWDSHGAYRIAGAGRGRWGGYRRRTSWGSIYLRSTGNTRAVKAILGANGAGAEAHSVSAEAIDNEPFHSAAARGYRQPVRVGTCKASV